MLLSAPLLAGAVACLAWWASTGAILVLVRRAGARGGRTVMLTLPVLAAGVWGFEATMGRSSVLAAYGAFASALLVWGWIELAFLAGVITGPNQRHLRPGVPEWERFVRAWGTVAYHEMTLTAALAALAILAHGAPNRVGLWAFALLYAARISAKLNLYLGVRKVNTAFLPAHLAHLPSHFRERRLNWLFPVSVTGLTAAAVVWGERAFGAGAPAAAAGAALLAALAALAVLEHWFMVVRLPDEKLWQWMLPERRDAMGEGTDAVR